MSRIRLTVGNGRVIFSKGKGQLSIPIVKDDRKKTISTNLRKLAEEKSENDEIDVKSVKIDELEDLPLYDFVDEMMKKDENDN